MKHIFAPRAVVMVLLLTSLAALRGDDAPPEKLMFGSLPAAKILFLGNSITLHGAKPEIGWTGHWGMAASAEEQDYVHLLIADIAQTAGAKPQAMVKNIADFERRYDTFDIGSELKSELEFRADIVILAIGENVSELMTDDARAGFSSALSRLLAELRNHGEPTIFVRSSFWENPVKDELLRKASVDTAATFVDISPLGREETNFARSERKIEHPGVAGHPGDKGMRALADAILISIRQRAGLPDPAVTKPAIGR